ncbi:hypothetical protein [Chitinophaga sp. Cy-1792]|uniref:hypothetical protein n=1 Tax=Chitinophaga sp. Cy-1792 TaxID=2608339 RepID=UPI00141FC27A|nr:hypothetical protein [Chitinophaga sp. Cy-1792]NIG56651.1 hypothetical protein [Chitinophaga sp. Cy-1792]
MKKLKIKLFLAALMIAGIFAFRYADDTVCTQPVPGYYNDPTGQKDPNVYLISGTYSISYTCLASPTNICRYVKNASGVYVPCSGSYAVL